MVRSVLINLKKLDTNHIIQKFSAIVMLSNIKKNMAWILLYNIGICVHKTVIIVHILCNRL